jgi:two-component system, LuxR family, response regulator FixJ
MKPTVFVVDDDPGLRRSTAVLLDSADLAFEAFDSAAAFLEEYRADRPGCLVLDLHMPGMSGIDLVERLRGEGSHLPILVVSGTGTIPLAVRGMKLGVLDFLVKPVEPDLLVSKIQTALELDARQRTNAAALDAIRRRLAALTPRERELLRLLVSGMANKTIAGELGISIKTVENHRASLMEKTGANNAADLVRMAMLVGQEV